MNIIPVGEEFHSIDPQMLMAEARGRAAALEARYDAHFKGTDLEGEWVESDVYKVSDSDGDILHELWVLIGANRKAV